MEIDLRNAMEEKSTGDDFESQKVLICDLTQHGQRFVLCQGGRGGLGNRNFATSRHQTPRFAQPGEVGIEGDYVLELRIVAGADLLGAWRCRLTNRAGSGWTECSGRIALRPTRPKDGRNSSSAWKR